MEADSEHPYRKNAIAGGIREASNAFSGGVKRLECKLRANGGGQIGSTEVGELFCAGGKEGRAFDGVWVDLLFLHPSGAGLREGICRRDVRLDIQDWRSIQEVGFGNFEATALHVDEPHAGKSNRIRAVGGA